MNHEIFGHLDEPLEKELSLHRIHVKGWILPVNIVDHLEINVNEKIKNYVEVYTEIRPDLAAAFPNIENADKGGFDAIINIDDMEGVQEIKFTAVLINGNKIEMWVRKIECSRKVLRNPPRLYHIGLINRCNLKCEMCPAHAEVSTFLSKGIKIDPKLIEASLEGLKSYAESIERIGLTDYGEPFLYEDIFDIIKRIHEICPKAAISITTNGTLLSDDTIEKILNSNITNIAISLDAGSKTTFEKIRKGAQFEYVISRIKLLVHKKYEKNKTTPIISTNFVLMKSNVNELPDYVRIASSINVDQAGTVNPMGVFDSDYSEVLYSLDINCNKTNNYDDIFKRALLIAKELNVSFYLPNMKPTRPGLDCLSNGRCFPYIDPYGDVYPCCILAAKGQEKNTEINPMGNIKQNKLSEIWESDKYVQFREAFYSGKLPDPVCMNCPKYYNI